RVGDKIFDTGILEKSFDARLIRTFGKRDPPRLPPEIVFVIRDGAVDLRAARLCRRDQRQESVSRTAGDDLDRSLVLKFAKCADEVAFVTIVPKSERCSKVLRVHLGDAIKLHRLTGRSMDFLV